MKYDNGLYDEGPDPLDWIWCTLAVLVIVVVAAEIFG